MAANWANILGLIGSGLQMMDPQKQQTAAPDFIKRLKEMMQKKMVGGPQLTSPQVTYGTPGFYGYTEKPSELQIQMLKMYDPNGQISQISINPFDSRLG